MLVIIGLIVGGILVGRDLIKAAEILARKYLKSIKSTPPSIRSVLNTMPFPVIWLTQLFIGEKLRETRLIALRRRVLEPQLATAMGTVL